jgi:hypothetical protein
LRRTGCDTAIGPLAGFAFEIRAIALNEAESAAARAERARW